MSLVSPSSATSLFSLARLFGPERVEAMGRPDTLRPIDAIGRVYGRPADDIASGAAEEDSSAVAGGTSLAPPPFDRRPASARIDLWNIDLWNFDFRNPAFRNPASGSIYAGNPDLGNPDLGNLDVGSLSRPSPSDAVGREGEAGKIGEPARPSERELRGKLAELEGEKGRQQRDRAGEAGQRSSEVSSLLSRLKARDGEVRAHESAHIAAGGRYITGGASYSYQKGPDGSQYAVGGEVGIDSSPIPGKPEETLAKMRIVRAAALAPAEPSGADLAVAGAAAQAEAAAMASLADRRGEKDAGGGASGSAGASYGSGSPPGSTVDLVA
jgi:hypothetical protein